MNFKNKRFVLVFLLCVAAAIRLLSTQSLWIEKYYSNNAYPFISKVLKYLFGWLPFSIGDLLYGLLVCWLLWKTGRLVKKIFRKEYRMADIKAGLYPALVTLLLVYICFNILWGLNYNRKGIAYQLGIKKEKYSNGELVMIDSLLVGKVNESKATLVKNKSGYHSSKENVAEVYKTYNRLSEQYPWLSYTPVSAKTSLWGWAGNYMGFIGYYNPFTGEAQLNTTVPEFLQPYTACHEVAHQLGYAKENEANFVGYLAAAASSDTLFHYSVYLDLYMYAQRNLFMLDSAKARAFSRQLIPAVRADLDELRRFNDTHQSPVEPVFKWIYGKYLEKNEQPSGLLSYDEVTGFIIAYYKKFGRI